MAVRKCVLSSLIALAWTLVFSAGGSAQAASFSFAGLGDLPGGEFRSYANGISADGSAAVGGSSSSTAGGNYDAFRWTESGGMVGLGDLLGGEFRSGAHAVSADGSVVVGQARSSSSGVNYEAFRRRTSAISRGPPDPLFWRPLHAQMSRMGL